MKTIADRVKYLIEREGININKAAHICGIKAPRLYDICSGKTQNPASETITKIAIGLKSSETFILRGIEYQQSDTTSLKTMIAENQATYKSKQIALSREEYTLLMMFRKLQQKTQDELVMKVSYQVATMDIDEWGNHHG